MTDEEIDAMEAGWKLDALIWEKVMGEFYIYPDSYASHFLPKYSTNIAAAWQVVERMVAQSPRLDITRTECWWTVGERRYNGEWEECAHGNTPMLAICRFALMCCKAVADKKEDAVEAS